ncbi:MAG: hypothetical protein ACLSHG_12860 [Oscillospiraceae bacterium]
MKRNGSYLRQYLPWLGLLLGVDALAALLLWLADARAIAAMSAVIVLATVFLFGGVCAGALRALEKAGVGLHGLSDRAGRRARTGAVPPALGKRGAERAPARRDAARAAAGHRAVTGADGRLRKLRGALGA